MAESHAGAPQKRHRLQPVQRARVRDLRRQTTIPERLIWSRLRDGRMAGLKWRRQYPVGPYIADFCCPSRHLVVELDGRTHSGRAQSDETRTRYIEEQGFRVIRVTDDEVIRDLDAAVRAIAVVAGVDT